MKLIKTNYSNSSELASDWGRFILIGLMPVVISFIIFMCFVAEPVFDIAFWIKAIVFAVACYKFIAISYNSFKPGGDKMQILYSALFLTALFTILFVLWYIECLRVFGSMENLAV